MDTFLKEKVYTDQIYQTSPFSQIKDIIGDLRDGKMVIVFDDEDRENEGDFIVCADRITEEHIKIMTNYGSGLIYLVIDQAKQENLGLKLLRKTGYAAHDPLYVSFAEPIDAADGIKTGISAADRLKTIQAACSKTSKPSDIITPGHVLTIVAHPMGLFARHGHTEASNTLVRLSGSEGGCAVGCEVILNNGELARLPDLIKISQNLNIKICRINDLIKYLRN